VVRRHDGFRTETGMNGCREIMSNRSLQAWWAAVQACLWNGHPCPLQDCNYSKLENVDIGMLHGRVK